MKTRIFSILLGLMISVTLTMAQNLDEGRTTFGILGGVNMQNLNGKDIDGDKLENDMIIGYHAGVNIQIPLVPQFYFQPGLLFSTKGAKRTDGDITSTYKVSYIELPLNLVYKALLGNGYIMLGFGPYVSYGIMGKAKFEGGTGNEDIDVEFTNLVTEGSDESIPYFRAFDAGGNIFAGYEMAGGLFFQFNTQIGMLKINPEYEGASDDKTAVKNTGFGLSVGYRF